ncbi:protein ALP [Salix suchowensis]|nr:protein ALP [Salix suchowensis]
MDVSKSGGKAKWSKETLHIFCDICIRAIDMGMRPSSHFEPAGWKFIVKSFGEQTGKPLQKAQLKNKWDENRGVNKFRESGIEPSLKFKFDRMFSGVTATGQHAWAPSSGTVPGSDDDLETLNVGLQETRYGLKPSRRMCVLEKVGMFLFTIAARASNRHVQERFQHSGKTVSRCMKQVLKALRLFAIDIIKPTDPDFTNTPIQIATNPRFMPHFKNCIGAIDGTHVRVTVSPENQIPYIGRKGVPTQNIMAACSFDMQFTFVWAGWEGSAHDTRIFLEGKYYLVDAGYPNEYGYLGPYRGERYHFQDF